MKVIEKFILGYIIFFLALSGLLFYIYQSKKELEIKKIDINLFEAAMSINKELKTGFHDRAINENSITIEEHNKNNIKLTELRRKYGLIYLYTAVEDNGKIYLTASSVTDIDIKNKTEAKYYYYYKDVSKELIKALKENKIKFTEYKDNEGYYRALFIPMGTEGGRRYVLAAEKNLDEVKEIIKKVTIQISIAAVTMFMLLFIMLAGYINKSENKKKEIKRINEELEKKYLDKQMELEKAKKDLIELNSTKDKLFSIIGHDIKGTIGNLMSIAEFMAENVGEIDGNNRKQIFDSIKKSVENAYFMAVNLFEWAKLQRDGYVINQEIIRVKEVIEKSINSLKNNWSEKEIEISLDIKDDIFIYVDQNNMELVLKNLILNSIKYCNRDGKIEIRLEKSEEEAIIYVIDNGEGIKSEKLKSIFDLYENKFTYGTKGEHGAGLGMILCKELTEKNGGRLEIKSDIEKGTEVKLYFKVN